MGVLGEFQKGCTGVSWLFRLFGIKLSAEECCEEHDILYDQGGTIEWKMQVDASLAKCVFKKSGSGLRGALRATVAWTVVTFVPYSYMVWNKPPKGGNNNGIKTC